MANDERQTPAWLFNLLNNIFDFTVDAAATADNALVGSYWDKEADGLKQSWEGYRVWCNPPYSRGQLVRWVEKAISERGAMTVMLLPGDCSTKAGQLALASVSSILFLNRRLAFDNEAAGAKFSSWIAVFHGYMTDVAAMQNLDIGIVL